jgi:hypothetical protein
MTVEILGRREDQRLEFKSKDALEDPSTIARAVVGMLNAEGGEVWIGVEEEDSAAAVVEPIQDPERARERLWNYLLDVVDPSPSAEEVSIELDPPGAGPALLVAKIQPAADRQGRKPYAFRKGGGWHFLRRVGARNHPMSRQEVFGESVRSEEDPALEEAIRRLEEARQRVRDEGDAGLWLGLQPSRRLRLDTQARRFQEITLDPSITGNRRTGWHFANTSHQPRLIKDGIEWGFRSELLGKYVTRITVTERGELRFWTALERLHRKGEQHEIWPLILLEYPISAFRVARVIYDGLIDPEDRVVADLALFGIGGWLLREGTPGDFFLGNDLSRPQEAPDLIWEPVVFTYREIDEAPDRCGFRLVRRVYQAFGWREEHMPRQYDREAGKLILPE